jgi:hypothetical protein
MSRSGDRTISASLLLALLLIAVAVFSSPPVSVWLSLAPVWIPVVAPTAVLVALLLITAVVVLRGK